MKAGTTLTTHRLLLRHWQPDTDAEAFHRLNSDDRVMHFFPFRRDEAACRDMMARIADRLARDGYGWCAFTLRATGAVIGFGGLARVDNLPCAPATEIGWRLLPEHWGMGYATEAAAALLRHAFDDMALDEVVSFAVCDNHASTAVMCRIGMTAERNRDFDHPDVPDSHPHLKRHVFYRITAQNWIQANRAR